MGTWEHKHTEITTATPAQVWSRWAVATTWAIDDPSVEWALFDGEPCNGSTGKLKSPGSPAQKFTFTCVEPLRRFDFAFNLPLGTVSITHLVEEQGKGNYAVTHGVRVEGPLSRVYTALLGRKIAAGFPDVVNAVLNAALVSAA
ncbi:polyketide cyclase/dehydrase and lipid transport [Nocardioides jejuensis]|uniref:Polyketide cyclase/dehydrase and lipid transport n=1 Tax=Nocardioides jejuensis TaxID=2502782 RepID=A0A4R1CB93_9ACTN|nr:polyketide cyclase/dehydrase and lipid transport [Nocardioides jejuensis]TCJ28354.1 polyketide cyclase/dehydrase and lipid transport [Nocardioides jejuensis]